MTQKTAHFFFYCKFEITMKDKINGMVKYMYLMLLMIKAMRIIVRFNNSCDCNEKITGYVGILQYKPIQYCVYRYITALYKNSKSE